LVDFIDPRYYTIETSINRVPRERPRDPDPLMF